ncbi:MAG: ParB/RepB/Spo0J family partition protein [Defluviitaleaceae bacterium]|nr:ParB/RepB/Spo0J family partition protein [Defluviitaleaceae bacterium]
MKILRAGLNDIDVFDKDELGFGACCFFSEDKKFRYFFKIHGREAILIANTKQYLPQAMEEFLFYSGFVTTIKNESGDVLLSRTPNEPFLCEISKIQPSQFYVNETKLENCKKWINAPSDILIPVVIRDGVCISLDGHTRMRAALDLGYESVFVYLDEFDEYVFNFANEAIKRRITSVSDMEIVDDKDYELKWHRFCDDFFSEGT